MLQLYLSTNSAITCLEKMPDNMEQKLSANSHLLSELNLAFLLLKSEKEQMKEDVESR